MYMYQVPRAMCAVMNRTLLAHSLFGIVYNGIFCRGAGNQVVMPMVVAVVAQSVFRIPN